MHLKRNFLWEKPMWKWQWDSYMVMTVETDILVPNGAPPSASTVLTTVTTLDRFSLVFLRLSVILHHLFNTLRPRQNGRRFADNTFRCIFLNENVRISIKISLKFVPKGPINNIPSLVQIMAWRRSGDKPLSEPMMVSLPTHICVTQPQWVNSQTSF